MEKKIFSVDLKIPNIFEITGREIRLV